jgi:hypothetical protein
MLEHRDCDCDVPLMHRKPRAQTLSRSGNLDAKQGLRVCAPPGGEWLDQQRNGHLVSVRYRHILARSMPSKLGGPSASVGRHHHLRRWAETSYPTTHLCAQLQVPTRQPAAATELAA